MNDPAKPAQTPSRITGYVKQLQLLSQDLGPLHVAQLAGFGLLMVFFALTTVTTARVPDLTAVASALSAGILGLVINPRPATGDNAGGAVDGVAGAGQETDSRAWWWSIGIALVVGALAGVYALVYEQQSAVVSLTAAVTALGGLFVDTTRVTHSANSTARWR